MLQKHEFSAYVDVLNQAKFETISHKVASPKLTDISVTSKKKLSQK